MRRYAKLTVDGVPVEWIVIGKTVRCFYSSIRGILPKTDSGILRNAKRNGWKWYTQRFNSTNNVRDICFDLPGEKP